MSDLTREVRIPRWVPPFVFRRIWRTVGWQVVFTPGERSRTLTVWRERTPSR